jgi:putative transposase
MVNRQLLLQNEYLIAENRILRSHLPARVPLTDPQRHTLAEIGKQLGCHRLEPVASSAKPETILGWYRKFDRPQVRPL